MIATLHDQPVHVCALWAVFYTILAFIFHFIASKYKKHDIYGFLYIVQFLLILAIINVSSYIRIS